MLNSKTPAHPAKNALAVTALIVVHAGMAKVAETVAPVVTAAVAADVMVVVGPEEMGAVKAAVTAHLALKAAIPTSFQHSSNQTIKFGRAFGLKLRAKGTEHRSVS